MEKENKFKQRFTRIFTSSCQTQNISEVIDHNAPIFTPKSPLIDIENDPFPSPITKPKQSPLLIHSTYPSMLCKPRCPDSFDLMIREHCFIPTSNRRKIAGRYDLLSPSDEFSGNKCPPVSPLLQTGQKQRNNKKKTKKNKHRSKRNRKCDKTHFLNHPLNLSSSNETDIDDWFSANDEKDEKIINETLFFSSKSQSFSSKSQSFSSKSQSFSSKSQSFSSKSQSFSSKSISFTSDSEPDYSNKAKPRSGVKNRRYRRRSLSQVSSSYEVGVMPLHEKVKDTFAVVKSSSDPYNDFRTSMVEMIIEKQIFGANELEQLLQCFLSLNSSHHHRVIVEVFTEILDALFVF